MAGYYKIKSEKMCEIWLQESISAARSQVIARSIEVNDVMPVCWRQKRKNVDQNNDVADWQLNREFKVTKAADSGDNSLQFITKRDPLTPSHEL